MAGLLENSLNSLVEAATMMVPAALFFAALCLATKRREVITALRAAWTESRINLELAALDATLFGPLIAMLAAAAGGFFVGRVGMLPIDWAAWGAFPALFAAVFVGDFVGYWRHRLEHSRLLWPSHAIHHSDTAMNWLTLHRFHPVNRLTTSLIDSTSLAACGFPAWAILANNLVRHWYGYFIHADLPWTYGPFGKLFVSPAMHRWHHVRDETLAGYNFATVFSIFDRAFGTLHAPGPCNVPLGVDIGRGLVAQLLHPARAWLPGRGARRAPTVA